MANVTRRSYVTTVGDDITAVSGYFANLEFSTK